MTVPTGDERIPLLYGGSTIALRDIPTADQSLRVPAVFGRPSVSLAEFSTNMLSEVPFISVHIPFMSTTELTSWVDVEVDAVRLEGGTGALGLENGTGKWYWG